MEHDEEVRTTGGAGSVSRRSPVVSSSAIFLFHRTFALAVCITLLFGLAGTVRAQAASRMARNAAWHQEQTRNPNHGWRGGDTRAPHHSAHRQPHLGQWIRQHQNMSLEQQEKALRKEPGFNRLRPERQQRLVNRLQQLDAMPAPQRERTLDRMEAFERLSPQQRQKVRSVMQQVSQLPVGRQRMMHHAFHELRQLPPDERQKMLDSPQFKDQFSDHEREILGNLMSTAPYIPLQHPAGDGAAAGGKQ